MEITFRETTLYSADFFHGVKAHIFWVSDYDGEKNRLYNKRIFNGKEHSFILDFARRGDFFETKEEAYEHLEKQIIDKLNNIRTERCDDEEDNMQA